jgi:Zn-dependent protease with chaperone function
VLLVAPWLIVRAWGTRPLPPGPLREALTDVRRRAGVTFGQMLLWPTGLNVANAAVLGVVRPFRYALLSDALVEFLDARDVEAVFHHEVRHVSAHHLFYLMLYVLSAATLCAWAGDGLVWLVEQAMEPQAPLGDGWRAGAALTLMLGAVGTSFGWISRRFERQCDAFAAWRMGQAQAPPGGMQPPVAVVADPIAVEGAAPPSGPAARRITPEGAAVFSWALQRIVQINCGSLHRPNWRHGSVAWRLQYLMNLSASGGTIDQVDRVVRRIKLGIGAAALAAAALLTVEVVAACSQQG